MRHDLANIDEAWASCPSSQAHASLATLTSSLSCCAWGLHSQINRVPCDVWGDINPFVPVSSPLASELPVQPPTSSSPYEIMPSKRGKVVSLAFLRMWHLKASIQPCPLVCALSCRTHCIAIVRSHHHHQYVRTDPSIARSLPASFTKERLRATMSLPIGSLTILPTYHSISA